MFRRYQNWISVIVAVIFTATVAAVSVSAATLTSLTHYSTNQEVGEAANHTLIFTTSSGVSEGDTILITFDALFDTSTITEDDVDIDDDTVDLTTAADCAGAEQASVAIAADAVTITICAGDGGAIAAASEVTVEIGTNATASGTGSNQVTFPSVQATFQIRVDGTFGDSGSVWIPLIGTGQFPVSLIVPSGGGGGGGGGTPPAGDYTAPIISNVRAVVLDDSSAWVTWDTDEAANSYIDYGLTESYEIGTEYDGTYQTAHSITLTSLTPGTLHYFQVRSADNNGNTATSSGYSFTTTDTTAPVISNVEVVDITTSSARVTWDTDESSDSYVTYGTDITYGSEVEDVTMTTGHSLVLVSLNDATEYHFMVQSTDAFGNVAQSSDDTFTTLTDQPPANVSGLTVTPGDAQNQLTWTNPNESDLDSVRVIFKTDSYPTGPDDGTIISESLVESYLHTGLINGQGYYYGIFVYDLAGQVSSGALGFGTPIGEELPPEDDEPDPDPDPDPDPGQDPDPDPDPGQDPDPGEDPDDDDDQTGPYCGDGVCGEGEDADSCPADCPVFDETGAEPVSETEVEFLAAENQIELFPINDQVQVLAGTELRVQIPENSLPQDVDHIELVVNNQLYLMSSALVDDFYAADVYTPSDPESYYLSITIFYADGSGQTIEYSAQVDSFGYTFEYVEGEIERVGSSVVTLYSNNNGQFMAWNGSVYGQLNPIATPTNGTFAWYVPIGEYYIVAEKDGYVSAETEVLYITNNIVNSNIEMTLLPPTLEEVVDAITGDDVAAGEIAEMIGDQIDYALEEIRQTPYVIETAMITLPILVGASVLSVTLMALLFNLLPLMQYLFTAPLLFFWRRKRKGWGVIYNAVTKMPIDLAIVRLYKMPNEPIPGVHPTGGKLMQTRVTDKDGRYFFLADVGTYRIAVTKPGYSFPSEFLVNVKDDGTYLDIYHGQAIEVTENEATIAANVPMGPLGATHLHKPSKIVLTNILRRAQRYLAAAGLLIAIVVAIIIPSWMTIIVASVQVLLFFLVKRVTKVRKPKGWGIVYDGQTKKPLGGVVVRIFEPKYNKLLETAITDKKGRYSFLVGPNTYFTRYEKKDYQDFEVRPIDFESKKEPSEITTDVYLEKQNK